MYAETVTTALAQFESQHGQEYEKLMNEKASEVNNLIMQEF